MHPTVAPTRTEHRIRTRIAWISAAAIALALGGISISWNLSRSSDRTDLPFWRQLWSGVSTQLRSARDELSKVRTAAGGTEAEAKQLSKQVFPELEAAR